MLTLLLRIVALLQNGNCHVKGEHEVQGVVVKTDITDQFDELEEISVGQECFYIFGEIFYRIFIVMKLFFYN